MTEEQAQAKAIFRLKEHKDFAGMDNGCCVINVKDLEIVLTLIEQQKEQINYLRRSCDRKEECLIEEQQENAELKNKLKEKDKIIELMTEYIDYIADEIDDERFCDENKYRKNIIFCDEDCKECIKQYFENKAKEV